MVGQKLTSRPAQERPEVPQTQYAERGQPDHQAVADAAIEQQRTESSLPDYTLWMKQAREGRA